MRKLFLILLILLPLKLLAQDVGADIYVHFSNGNDVTGDGSYASPYKTPQKAIEEAIAGDDIVMMGGTFLPDATFDGGSENLYIYPAAGHGATGTAENPITLRGHPNEDIILDFRRVRSTTGYMSGIAIRDVGYWRFKDFTIRNLYQTPGDSTTIECFYMYGCNNMYLEGITVHHCAGRGISLWGYSEFASADTSYLINCDVYDICDSIPRKTATLHEFHPGNLADGMRANCSPKSMVYYIGCRAWECSDDGFDGGTHYQVFVNCWSFKNGRLSNGDGNGWKFGPPPVARFDSVAYAPGISYPKHYFIRCLAAFNSTQYNESATGFQEIDYEGYYRNNARIYNCTSWKNNRGFGAFANPYRPFRNSVYRNNLAYGSYFKDGPYSMNVYIKYYSYPESNNTWDFVYPDGSYPPWFEETDTVTVTPADFVLTDSVAGITQLTSARKSVGDEVEVGSKTFTVTLPDVTFLQPVEGSDLVDAGIQIPAWDNGHLGITLSFSGAAPDIGFNEYDSGTDVPVTSITVSGTGGATTIATDNGTLQMLAAVLPEDATIKAVTWTRINGTGSANISGSGLLTAVSNGTVTVRATATDGSGVYDDQVITISNQDQGTATDIQTFSIFGQTGLSTINPTNHTVAVTMPYGTNVTNLTATWTLSEGATSVPTSGTPDNYTTPQTITVTAEDNVTVQAWTVTITVAPYVPPPAGGGKLRKTVGHWAKTIYNNRAK